MHNNVFTRLYLFAVIIMSGGGSLYYNSAGGNLTRLLIATGLIILNRVPMDKRFMKTVLVWLVFGVISSILAGRIYWLKINAYLVLLFEAYALIKLLGKEIVSLYCKYMVILAFVSLIGWTISLIDANYLIDILRPINISGGFREELGDYVHVILYTVHGGNSSYTYGFTRNTGFCWEPGPYSILLLFAIYFYASLLKKNLLSFRFVLLLVALLSTFSTTGYVAMLLYVAYSFWVKSKNIIYLILLVTLFWASIGMFSRIDFIGGKISDVSEAGIQMSKSSKYDQASLAGGRLSGLPIVLQDLRGNPLMGKALSEQGEYEFYGMVTSRQLNGIFAILSYMGIFGFAWFVYFLLKSTRYFAMLFDSRGTYSFALILIASMFGFNAHMFSIIFAFLLFGFFGSSSIVDFSHRKSIVSV